MSPSESEPANGSRPTRWTWLAYGYAALVACALGYGLLGMPVQVSDSLNNLIEA